MSWLAENYHKAAIGAGAFAAVAVGALIFLGQGKLDEDFPAGGSAGGKKDGTPMDWKVKWVDKSLDSPISLTQPTIGERKVNLFVGVPTYVSENDKETAIDLPKSGDVHEGIPNTWWLENNLDLGFTNSPEQDVDKDGFSAREEFNAKSDPRSASSHPPLVNKLVVVDVKERQWLIKHNGSFSGKTTLTLNLSRREVYRPGAMEPGTIFPDDGPFKGAFKFVNAEDREELNERTNTNEVVNIAIVEDLRPGLEGRRYEVRSRAHRTKPKIGRHYLGADRTVDFTLNAIGQGEKVFSVPEGGQFSLPAGQDEKPFSVAEVSGEKGNYTVKITGPGIDSPTALPIKL